MDSLSVFISYSHDSDDHRSKVLALSERLRADGIVTILDQYVNGSPSEGWPRWMLNGLNTANRVVCVCTETYRRRFLGQEAPGKGKGVDWEGAQISQHLYDARSHTNRFIPVMFHSADEVHIPEPLRSLTFHIVDSDAGYQAFYDDLLSQLGVEPGAVGSLKRKPRISAQPLTFMHEVINAAPTKIQAGQSALSLWKEKLDFFLVEEAVCVDPAMRFRLKHLIAEAQERIRQMA